ncbi:glucan biosynthesis protein [Sphingomonas sp. CL5.1]|uniref:glucan biosynthesis protein n=1 Tax=Sphingomonas sp. CL5.1 TaxID=2653203 RepID=UPI0015818FBD|nr:glucan biosynthesis protein [Sphingomonas sp. CL5.1]QKS00539.1 glucan biosynthesis protein [Sphingomonas sp. CL5.1]
MVTAQARAATPRAPEFGPPTPFSWDRLVSRAQALATRRYVARQPAHDVAPDFDAATRRAYGAAERLAGFVRLMPATYLAPVPVSINLVEDGMARPLIATDGLFAGDEPTAPAGFRVLNPNLSGDWLAFLGASYFRAVGPQDQYGLSARGIAVDTGLDGPEEFPSFTDFWIEPVSDRRLKVHALLDGPSIAGAYAFDCALESGGVTQSVRAALFPRRDIRRLGIAPASSMFWYDQNDRRAATDWRPEIHDSDGLAIWSGSGERIWRPLANPPHARTASFRADGVKGFGLIQRDQRFADYQDDGAFYDRRPSLWVEPVGDWGAGAVLLYEMPTDGETNDNIVAFWQGDRPARAGERRDVAYRLRWMSQDPFEGSVARVVDNWAGAAGIPGTPPIAGARKYVVDFEGKSLIGLDRRSGVEAVVNVGKPALLAIAAYPVVGQPGRWRVTLDIRADAANPKELRLFLRRDNSALSETLIEPLSP